MSRSSTLVRSSAPVHPPEAGYDDVGLEPVPLGPATVAAGLAVAAALVLLDVVPALVGR